MKKNLKFEIFNHSKIDDRACYRITEGKFKNLEYAYGKVNLEGLMREPPTLSFTYELVEGILKDDDEPEFKQLIGDNLVELILLGEGDIRRE